VFICDSYGIGKKMTNTVSDTLEVMSHATRYNRWIYETIKPYCKGKILEIGSGKGVIGKMFQDDGYDITMSDINGKFGIYFDVVKDVWSEKFDTIISINVLEHLDDDQWAIKNIMNMLNKNGKYIHFIPAIPRLYNVIDYNLGHKLRVDKYLFLNDQVKYFNALGILGWYFFGNILCRSKLGSEVGWFDRIVPLAKLIDKVFRNKIGLSLIVVGEKV